MSQINSRKRKGAHLDEHPQFNQQINRGYLINTLNNNLHHSIQPQQHQTIINNQNQNFIPHHHQTTTQQQQTIYQTSNGQNIFQIDNQLNTNHIPNKLLILNSNTNSSSGSVVDESSRSEFASIDSLTDVINLNTNNSNTNNSGQRKQRHETSLGQLTKKFVGLLQNQQGELNLNDASAILQVQKRRIYDITNVLEGVGLLSKTFKNKIKWTGTTANNELLSNNTATQSYTKSNNSSCTITNANQQQQPLSINNFNKILNQNNQLINSQNDVTKSSILKNELKELEAKENEIDEKMQLALNDLNQFTENNENKRYSYLTYVDIKRIKEFSNQTVIAIKAPAETKLELADPTERLQMFLKSDKGEIEVFICPSAEKEQDNTNTMSSSCDLKSQSDDQGKGESITSEMDTQQKQGQKNIDHLKYAFISEDDDLGPMGNRNLLMQTDDQAYQLSSILLNNKLNTSEFNTSCSDQTNNLNISPASNSSITDMSFLHLQPPLTEADYNFALEDSEGITDLFDEMLPEYK